jgi:hypothetical protein
LSAALGELRDLSRILEDQELLDKLAWCEGKLIAHISGRK